jgi:hypothetical protein
VEYWKIVSSPIGIVMTCWGHDKTRAFESAIPNFHKLIGEREGPFQVVGDLRDMTGYETEARIAWQDAFYQHRKRIEALVLIGGNTPLIKMGAAVLGALTGIPVRFVPSWSDVSQLSGGAK